MLKGLNLKTKVYLFTTYITAIILAYFTFKKYSIFNIENIKGILFFSILSIIVESLPVYYQNIGISTGFTITLASILLFNPSVAILVISIGTLFRMNKVNGRRSNVFNTPLYKSLFNISIFIVSIVLSSEIFRLTGGNFGFSNFKNMLLPILALSVMYLVVNYSLLYYLLHVWIKYNFFESLFKDLKIGMLNIIGMIPLGVIVAIAFKQYSYFGVLIVFGPILLARYSFTAYLSMKKSYVDTVNALSLAIEAKDKYTEGHSSRVSKYAEKIGKKMKFSDSKLERLKIASMLHDIGKIGIPEAILNKPGRLTDEEYNTIKSHTVIGANIIKDVDSLKEISDIVKYHHERYDGRGYPEGLKGNEIPIYSYIISLADAYDAMCSNRPYRKAMTSEQAIEIIKSERGRQFNPKIVDVFLKIVSSMEEDA